MGYDVATRGSFVRELPVIMVPSTQEIWNRLQTTKHPWYNGPITKGYVMNQDHGQRKFYEPNSKFEPPEGTEVFVGSLPRDLYEDVLVPLFMSQGIIHELRLMMNFSGTNRGFCFVKYKDINSALKARMQLNRFEIRPGVRIGVLESVNNRRLYIGNLDPHLSQRNVLKRLKIFLSSATSGVEDIRVCFSRNNNTLPGRRYAIVTYRSHKEAAMARRTLILNRDQIDRGSNDVRVDWAMPLKTFNLNSQGCRKT